jgi:L-alanine-DL-glutamate epimerase-like enolase superfamily enzyme
MKLVLHPYDLKLKHRFKIAHDLRDVQKTLIVELQHGDHSGFGEATASIYYKNSIEDMMSLLKYHRTAIESYDFEVPEQFWNQLKEILWSNSFALSAVDVAVNDLYAKYRGLSLSEMWGTKRDRNPISNYTIGIDTVENMTNKLKEFPWPLYKIKLGTTEDIRIIKELRKITPSVFRVDANCGWEVDEALKNSEEMKSLGVEFIEQPLAADNWEGMKILYKQSALPVIADESVINEEDIARCSGYFHGVNIKLMKCGGLTPARRMIKNARSMGMKVMVGCMTESSVGISAVAQLLPTVDHVDMDGFLLLENDLADGPKLVNNKIQLPKGAGIGVTALYST